MYLKIIYTLFVGILVAMFVGFGVEAFYPSPQYPEYPEKCQPIAVPTRDGERLEKSPSEDLPAECDALIEQHNEAAKNFQDRSEQHNRNVSLISLTAAILILVASLALAHRIEVLADGLLLGGTLTLFYSLIRGLAGGDLRFSFFMVTIGLVITLVIGYFKFIQPLEKQKK